MQFVGKIKAVDLGDPEPDVVEFAGHINDRHCHIKVIGMGIGEVLVGQFGLGKDEATVTLDDDGDRVLVVGGDR